MGRRFAVSGPYQATTSSSTSVTFTRNPEWHILSRPAYAEVVVRSYATDPEMFAAATGGQIDLSQGYQVLDFVGGVLSGSLSGLAMRLFPLGGLEHLEPNITGRYVGHNAIRYLTDPRVREALNLVIDRRKLLHTALDIPWAMTANLPAFGPEIPGRFDGVAVKGTWDPINSRFVSAAGRIANTDARRLLDEAGWHMRSDGWRYHDGCRASTPGCRLDMTFLVPKVYFNRLREAQFVAQEWKRALGVKVFLDASQWGIGNLVASYEENGPCARGWFDLCLFAQLPGTDPQTDFQFEFPSDRIARLARHPRITDLNFTGVRDRFIDHIFAEAPTVYDLAKRAALYRAWQIRVAKNADWIPLFQQPFIVLQRETIRGFNPSPTGPEWDPWALAPSA
jgi:ABC-type transport system substrate-binding protein